MTVSDVLFKEDEMKQLYQLVEQIPTSYGYRIITLMNLVRQKRMLEKVKEDQEKEDLTQKDGPESTTNDHQHESPAGSNTTATGTIHV